MIFSKLTISTILKNSRVGKINVYDGGICGSGLQEGGIYYGGVGGAEE